MRTFLTGATGVVGTRALPALVADGHEVTAVARGDEKAELVRRLGASPVRVDLFDPTAVKSAVEGHEAVIHLATHIPPMARMARAGSWETNDRLRTEASTHLVEAALATGATHVVQESICFPYQDAGDEWIDEGSPRRLSAVFDAVETAEANTLRFADAGRNGVVLRFAQFYAPDASHVASFHALASKRINPFFGPADSYTSFVHAEDAGTAVAAALRAPSGVYNVADDQPLTRGEAGEVVAEALGVGRLLSAPRFLFALLPEKATALTRSLRVSNRRFVEAVGWSPRYPSIREGWPTVVGP